MWRTFIAVALLSGACGKRAAPPPAARDAQVAPGSSRNAAIAAGRARLQQVLAADAIPGLAVAVVVGDELVWSEGFGVADLATRRPVTADTRFRLASVSKLVTAAVLGRLVDAGALDLDAPAGARLPGLPAALHPITARQLAGHLGGVRHYDRRDLTAPQGPFASVTASLEVFAGDALVAPPGTRYLYSTYGFVLLGALLEHAGGAPFLELVGREVAGPLALSSLGADDGAPDPLRTGFHGRGAGGPEVEPPLDQSGRWAGGGLRASAPDLARFAAAHRAPGYLTAPTLATTFTGQQPAGGEPTGVGLGWRVATDARGRRYVHHAGNMAGARALALLYPAQGVAIAILSNLAGAPAEIEQLGLDLVTPFLP